MKQFNLEEYIKNPLIKVVTRDGKLVKIRCTNYHPPQPVIAEIEGFDYATSFSSDGKYYRNRDSRYDLFFASENHEETVYCNKRGAVSNDKLSVNDLFFAADSHEGWINIYKNDDTYRFFGGIYESKEEAENRKDHGFVTSVKIKLGE